MKVVKEDVFLGSESLMTGPFAPKPIGNIPDRRRFSRARKIALTSVVVLALAAAAVWASSLMPKANELVQEEMSRIKKDCDSGDKKACEYLAFAEKQG